jgi:hypothetical protein
MVKIIVTFMARAVIVVGILLLVRILHQAVNGSLSTEFFAQSQVSSITSLYALLLGLPVPSHVISIGLILQRRWLSPPWAKFAWIAIVGSGCWLGASLAVRFLIS